jgi:autotransporter adhesin
MPMYFFSSSVRTPAQFARSALTLATLLTLGGLVDAQVTIPAVAGGAAGVSCPSTAMYGSDDPATFSAATSRFVMAQADCQSNIAVGPSAQAGTDASANNSALTAASTALGGNSIAAGNASLATGNQSVALGRLTEAANANAVALGAISKARGIGSVALGAFANSTGGGAVALGTGSAATGANSVAIGAGSSDGGQANVVSFGDGTVNRSLININNVTAGGNLTVGGSANLNGISNNGAGVANAGLITGVTAGAVSAVSTDAVNGSQLFQVQGTAQQALTAANQQGTQSAAQSIQIAALVNGQLGVCTVSGGALQCSVQGQAPARAEGHGAVAVGIGAQAQGDGAQAIGNGARALFAGSVAIGAGAQALADPTTAVGSNAIATGNNAVALGANTLASGNNAVALGQGSVADRPDSVSFGNAAIAYQRRLTNVAEGTEPTDAVNVAQMERSISTAFGEARKFAARGIAQAMAMPSIPVLAPGRKWAGAALGQYAGQVALGVGVAYQVDSRWNIGGGVAVTGGSAQVGAKVQTGYQW